MHEAHQRGTLARKRSSAENALHLTRIDPLIAFFGLLHSAFALSTARAQKCQPLFPDRHFRYLCRQEALELSDCL